MSNADIAEEIITHTEEQHKEKYLALWGKTYTESPLIICDAAEPKSINDLRQYGIKATACKKYAGSVLYGIKWLQSKILVIDPARTPVCYQEFTQYEYLTTKDGEFLADVPDRDNHCIDGVRYALDSLINSRKYSA